MLFLLFTLCTTFVYSLVDVGDPVQVQALYSRIAVSGTTTDTLTDVLRAAGVTPDWAQRSAGQIAQASGIPLQSVFSLINNLVPLPIAAFALGTASPPYTTFGLGPTPPYTTFGLGPTPPLMGYPPSPPYYFPPTPAYGFIPSPTPYTPYGGGYPYPPPPSPFSYPQTTTLQQLLERIRLYGTTKDSFEKLLRASRIDLNMMQASFGDFVYASNLAWQDVQEIYMKLKMGDACFPNPCASGACVPSDVSCVSCPRFTCVTLVPPTFEAVSRTTDPMAFKQMLYNVPGDPRLLAQSIPALSEKSGLDMSKVTEVVQLVISEAVDAAAREDQWMDYSLGPEDAIMKVAARVNSSSGLFDGLQRLLATLQGSVDPTPFASLIPSISRASGLTQAQVGLVFANLAKTSRGTFVLPPSPPTSMFNFGPPTTAPPSAASPAQLQNVMARLGPGMSAEALESTLAQAGVPIPQLGTLLQQIATTTRLPTPTVSGILTRLLSPNAFPVRALGFNASAPPAPAPLLSIEYVISALTPAMTAEQVKTALMQVKDLSTITPYRSYIVSRTQLSLQQVDAMIASLVPPTPPPRDSPLPINPGFPSPPTPSLPPSPLPPLSQADQQLLDNLTPTSPQALFFSLKAISVPALLDAYTGRIAASTQIAEPTVQRVVAAVLQSLASENPNGLPSSPPAPSSGSGPLPPTPLSVFTPTVPFVPSPTPSLFAPTPFSSFPPPTPSFFPSSPTPSFLPPTPPSFPPPTPAFMEPPTPFFDDFSSGPSPTPFAGSFDSPQSFVNSLPTDKPLASDFYDLLKSSPFPASTLIPLTQQIATRTGLDVSIVEALLNNLAKTSSTSSGPVASPDGTDNFDAVLSNLRDGMTLDEVRTILDQQIANPRTLSVYISSIAFRTGLEVDPVGEMVQALIKAKSPSG